MPPHKICNKTSPKLISAAIAQSSYLASRTAEGLFNRVVHLASKGLILYERVITETDCDYDCVFDPFEALRARYVFYHFGVKRTAPVRSSFLISHKNDLYSQWYYDISRSWVLLSMVSSGILRTLEIDFIIASPHFNVKY